MKTPVFLAIFALFTFAVLATGCQDDACEELQAEYDRCCSVCSDSGSSNCSMSVESMSEDECAEQLPMWQDGCVCFF